MNFSFDTSSGLGGNRMLYGRETWETCEKHGEYETTGCFDPVCPGCEDESDEEQNISTQQEEL